VPSLTVFLRATDAEESEPREGREEVGNTTSLLYGLDPRNMRDQFDTTFSESRRCFISVWTRAAVTAVAV
jgi:hypothetical protein